MAVYPFVGGVSGNPFKNLARKDLKISKTWIVLTSLGSRFHSLALLLLQNSFHNGSRLSIVPFYY